MPDTLEGAAPGASSPLCPRDRTVLTAIESGVAGSRCSACDGLFLRSPEITAAIVASGIDRDKIPGIFSIPPACAECGAVMDVFVLAGLEIDVCRACRSVWLDKGELEKVNAYLASDPAKNVDTRRSSSADDFGILGGIYSARKGRYEDELDSEVFLEIFRALRLLMRI